MSNKDTMICDIETGICGPVGESSSVIELIDLTSLSPINDSDSVNEQAEKDK
ncbi:hypothetical protein SAMN05518871_105161 [Psychrobacillus sp. OK028]|uniref:hypothetical protein n=1 Tax=Psychrobacillus sp. OK028 TaxID=1884359 RepID=UPI000891F051|nr:hypothetical protein [Psychrobacillus sp. OK028]SDN44565.1 hypothetical protein SAMN05518871_105161 [Psychrobacillus sp. OK028]